MSAPPPWDITSTREREDNAVLVDITLGGAARARVRHQRWRFDLRYEHMPASEAAAVQGWCESNDGQSVSLTWRDGITYTGLLAEFTLDRGESPLQSAHVIIRGAVAAP